MLLDVSQPLWAGMPKLPGLPEVSVGAVTQIARGDPLNISRVDVATHAGTHVDAPVHAIAGGKAIDEISLEHMCGPGTVVQVERGPGEEIVVSDLAGSDVRNGDIVLLATGWADHFGDETYFDHPYPSVELAQWLVDRHVKMVGIDCCTVDMPVGRRPRPFAYPVHKTLLGNDVLIIENLADLASVAGKRGMIYAFPLAWRGADAAHARVVVEV